MQLAKKQLPAEETRESVLSECDEEEALVSVDGSMDRTFMSDDLTRKESEDGGIANVCGFGFDDIALGILSCFGDATEQEKACASVTWESDFEESLSIESTRSEREEKARKWKLARAREAKKNKRVKKSRREREEC